MKELRAIRIVCATTGDTRAESTLVSSIVSELNQGIALDYGIHFELLLWDTDEHPRFQLDPPPSDSSLKLKIENCEVLICIFWTRVGATTADNISASYEIERAHGIWRKHGIPHVLSYFNKSDLFPTSKEEEEQLKEIEDFKHHQPEALVWWHYSQLSELKRLIHTHLTYLIRDQLAVKSVHLEQSPTTTFSINDNEYLHFVAGRMELSNSIHARMRSCYTLGKLGGERATAALANALEDKAREVRIRAIESLGMINDALATSVLIKALNSQFSDTRAYASAALEEIRGEEVVEAFIDALSSLRSDVRARAAEALGNIRHGQAAEALIKSLKEDKTIEVRANAVTALEKIGGETAVQAIIDALKDSARDVRFKAVDALIKTGDSHRMAALADAITSHHSDTRLLVAQALWQIGGERALTALIIALDDASSDVRNAAVESLRRLDDPRAATVLVEALSSQFPDVRLAASKALSKSDSLLLDLIRSSDSNTRLQATRALGQIGGERATSALINAIADAASEVRTTAVEALGRLNNEQATSALISALNSRHSDVRAAASYALGSSGRKENVLVLVERLRDVVSYVRERAAEALGNIGNIQAVPALIETLQADDSSEVRESVVTSLGKIGGEIAFRALVDAVKDPANNVRVKAVDVLMMLNDHKVKEVLIDRLQEVGREEALEESRSFIVHEMKSAIGPLRMAAKRLREILSEPGLDSERLLSMAQKIIEQADQAYRVIEQYINYTRPIKPALKPTNIPHLLKTCVEKASLECEGNDIRVFLETKDALAALVDPSLIEQAIRNIIINAIEAMGRGGILNISSYTESSGLIIAVDDTGPGIKPEHINHIFDVGFTTKLGQQGAGLGLAFVRRIIEDIHKGRVFIDNKPNLTGTVVTVHLPIAFEG